MEVGTSSPQEKLEEKQDMRREYSVFVLLLIFMRFFCAHACIGNPVRNCHVVTTMAAHIEMAR
jgi:hypothetical protein